MAFNTGNPLGSTDARDLSDNAQNFDQAINGPSATWVDRLDNTRISLRGQIGYTGTGASGAIQSYASGLVLSGYNVIILYSGEFYRPSASATLPYTTTATLPDVDSNLASIGDANLRQDLAGDPADGLGATLVNGAVIRVTSISAMEAYSAPVGYVFSLNAGGRSGVFDVVSGDFSTELAADTLNGIYVGLADNVTGTTKVAKRRDAGFLTAEMFGALFDGSDDSAAWNALATNMPSGSVISSTTPGGTTKCESSVTFTKDVIFDCPNITINMGVGTFEAKGAYQEITASLSANAEQGSQSISVDTTSEFNEGDLFTIQDTADFSFSKHRPVYYKGEFIEVVSVSAGEVGILSVLRDNYTASATVKLFKMAPITVSAKGINFIGGGNFILLGLDLCRNVYFENVSVQGGLDRAAMFRRCYGVRVVGGDYVHRESATLETHYGIAVANCQDVILEPRLAFGTRHGVTTGGFSGDAAIVCRDVFIVRANVANDNYIYAADFHGNSENCWYIDCTINNRVGIAGKNCGVKGGSVDSKALDDRVLSWHEVVAGDMVFQGVKCIVRGSCTGFGYSSSYIMQNVEENFRIVLDDIVYDWKSTSGIPGISGNFADGSKVTKWETVIRNIQFIGDTSSIDRVSIIAISNPASFASSPVPITRLYIDNISIDNINGLSNWVLSSGGALATGSLVTLPSLTFREVISVPAGGYKSATFSKSFPAYPEEPRISMASDRVITTENFFAIPVVEDTNFSSFDFILTTLDSANTVTNTSPAVVWAEVGMKNHVMS